MTPLEALAANIDAKACESILVDFGTYTDTLKTVVLPALLDRFNGCPKADVPPMPLESNQTPAQTREQAFALEIAWRAKCRVAKCYSDAFCNYDRNTIRFAAGIAELGLLANGNPIGRGAAVQVGHACLDAIHEMTPFEIRDAILEIREARSPK